MRRKAYARTMDGQNERSRSSRSSVCRMRSGLQRVSDYCRNGIEFAAEREGVAEAEREAANGESEAPVGLHLPEPALCALHLHFALCCT